MTHRAWFSRLVWHPARTERLYSYNPGARAGQVKSLKRVETRFGSAEAVTGGGLGWLRTDHCRQV